MIYLICQNWSNTSNNHAGIKYLCLRLEKRYPDTYKTFVIPDFYSGISKNRVVRKYVDRYVFLFSLFQKQFEEMADYKNFTNKLNAILNPLVYGDFISREEFGHKECIVLVVGRMLELQKKFSRTLRARKKVETDERSWGGCTW